MRVLLWHVDGPWTAAFVQGGHTYYLPVTPDRGPDGVGRPPGCGWPANVREVLPAAMRDLDIDVVVLQRPHESALVARWLGRTPGRDVAAVYAEHEVPPGGVAASRHSMADQSSVPVVHVTGFNDLFWDCGSAPTVVVARGVADPGYRYTGDLPRAATVVREAPLGDRRTGADLLAELAAVVPVDVFGPDTARRSLHELLARRRVYVHTPRWTSMEAPLIEAMLLGMPVVAIGSMETSFAVPAGAGVVTTSRAQLVDAVCTMVGNRDWAVSAGLVAREHALEHHALERFLCDWDVVLADAC